ncbi:Protein kinase domain-containing protein [Psidium guajava]|nr:Protein kinase domain-containing protein [Psidium guajava]
MSAPRHEGALIQRATRTGREKVVVAVRAEKVVSKAALAWALSHVVQPGDNVTLLAIFACKRPGRIRLWNFARTTGDGGASNREELLDRISRISDSCSLMVMQFHDQVEVRVRIKVVSDKPGGVVADEARKCGANWVILDKNLKQELTRCLEEVSCNIAVMKGSQAKVLKLNLGCSNELQTPFYSATSSPFVDDREFNAYRMKHSTPVSSPELFSPHTRTTGQSSSSSYDTAGSFFHLYERNPLFEGQRKGCYSPYLPKKELKYPFTVLESYGEKVVTLSKTLKSPLSVDSSKAYWIPQNHMHDVKHLPIGNNQKATQTDKIISRRWWFSKFIRHNHSHMNNASIGQRQAQQPDQVVNASIRDVVSLGRTSSVPPPLCSLCQHKAPTFGKPPRRFSYGELEEATDGFSDLNFLAEGGFGWVHRGILSNGQVVAVKQLKFGGAQGDADFCREVRLLSCAQHRNVVLLIGFCSKGSKRLLVYEYVCNGSLDFHLHGRDSNTLNWESRLKIAIGAARGLRYLHEDCRVGCIVHRDMRPKNILLTHDFEPLVADFGLARWYSGNEIGPEELVIGTSGYLAPEFVDGGKISEKVDVYAFGVVLLELMTGRRIIELQFKGESFFSQLFGPFAAHELKEVKSNCSSFIDPCFSSNQSQDFGHQLQVMSHAALSCLHPDPESRPPMSKVVRILEGQSLIPLALDLNAAGSRSGHLNGVCSRMHRETMRNHSRKHSH